MVNGFSTADKNHSTANTENTSTYAKIATANKGAHAANQANTVEKTPAPSDPSSHLTPEDELAEYLRLEAALKAKIAALRTATATATAPT